MVYIRADDITTQRILPSSAIQQRLAFIKKRDAFGNAVSQPLISSTATVIVSPTSVTTVTPTATKALPSSLAQDTDTIMAADMSAGMEKNMAMSTITALTPPVTTKFSNTAATTSTAEVNGNNSNNRLATGQIVAIALGSAVFIAIVIGLFVFCSCKKPKNQDKAKRVHRRDSASSNVSNHSERKSISEDGFVMIKSSNSVDVEKKNYQKQQKQYQRQQQQLEQQQHQQQQQQRLQLQLQQQQQQQQQQEQEESLENFTAVDAVSPSSSTTVLPEPDKKKDKTNLLYGKRRSSTHEQLQQQLTREPSSKAFQNLAAYNRYNSERAAGGNTMVEGDIAGDCVFYSNRMSYNSDTSTVASIPQDCYYYSDGFTNASDQKVNKQTIEKPKTSATVLTPLQPPRPAHNFLGDLNPFNSPTEEDPDITTQGMENRELASNSYFNSVNNNEDMQQHERTSFDSSNRISAFFMDGTSHLDTHDIMTHPQYSHPVENSPRDGSPTLSDNSLALKTNNNSGSSSPLSTHDIGETYTASNGRTPIRKSQRPSFLFVPPPEDDATSNSSLEPKLKTPLWDDFLTASSHQKVQTEQQQEHLHESVPMSMGMDQDEHKFLASYY